jgi:hypothetical protein
MKMTYTKGYPSRDIHPAKPGDIHLAKQGISIQRTYEGRGVQEGRDITLV